MANDQTDHHISTQHHHSQSTTKMHTHKHTHTFTIILSLSWVYLFFASKTRKTIYRNLTRSNIFYYFHSFVTHFSLLLLCLCACRCLFRTFSIPKKIFYIYKYCQRNPVCYIFIMLLLSWLLCSSFFAHCSAMLGLLSVDLCFSFTFHGKKKNIYRTWFSSDSIASILIALLLRWWCCWLFFIVDFRIRSLAKRKQQPYTLTMQNEYHQFRETYNTMWMKVEQCLAFMFSSDLHNVFNVEME